MTRPRVSDRTDPIQAPMDREKAVSAAYLRLTGSTQIEAASAAGIDPRTLGRWESCSWWGDVQREASERWLSGLVAKARRGLELAVEGDGRLALSVLERLEPALAPPRLRTSVEVESGADLLQSVTWRFVMALHLYRNVGIAEAYALARREPEKVQEWGRRNGILPAKTEEIVVDPDERHRLTS